MPINITMPALSPTMEEGNLARWLVKEGDNVSAGDVIAEIETDKATMEVEAVDEGVIAKILIPKAPRRSGSMRRSQCLPKKVKMSPRRRRPVVGKQETSAVAASSPAPAESSPVPAPAESAAPGPVAAANGSGGNRTFASPLARRIAKDAGIDIAAISGTGPKGRVVKADVEAAIASGGAAAKSVQAAADTATPKPIPDDAALKLFEGGSYELVGHDTMRKTIARRLVEAKSTVPHFYLTIECELDALLKLRGDLNKSAPVRDGRPAYKLSVNDMIIKALALSLRDTPDANVSWTDENMVRHAHADVGVAVSIPGGLITPIVRRAEEKNLSTISNEMKDMAGRARDRKLKPEEYQGGSSTVSNLGMMGVKEFSAVINPPHATILAVGAGEQRAVVRDGAVAIATMMSVTLSTDHRAVDGALGAELLAAFRAYIENPMSMLV